MVVIFIHLDCRFGPGPIRLYSRYPVLARLGWDDHYYRLISVLFDPNFTGLILVLGLILIYFNRPRSWWLYAIHLLALLLTYSRSSYLALLVAGLYLAIVNKKLKFFLLGFSALCLVLFCCPVPATTALNWSGLFRLSSAGKTIKPALNYGG